jgi:hypothetical protein
MALGGVARVGRVQLAQPTLTLAWSALLLGEHVSIITGLAAAAVIVVTAVGRNAGVPPVPAPGPAAPPARTVPAPAGPDPGAPGAHRASLLEH